MTDIELQTKAVEASSTMKKLYQQVRDMVVQLRRDLGDGEWDHEDEYRLNLLEGAFRPIQNASGRLHEFKEYQKTRIKE